MNDDRAIYEAVLAAQSQGESAALATVVKVTGSVPRHEGSKMLIRSDKSFVGTVGGGKMESLVIDEAVRSLQDGQCRLNLYELNDIAAGDPGICGGTLQVFIEPVGVIPQLIVIGCGHVGKALAELAKWSGYRVIACDDREDFCNPSYLPNMDGYVVCPPAEVSQHVTINRMTYVAALTRGLPVDMHLIPALLGTDAAYIGLIGSRRRWSLTMKALQEEHGFTRESFLRIHAPIGLELEAETPQEIALSILAEITMLRRGGSGNSMKWLEDDIKIIPQNRI